MLIGGVVDRTVDSLRGGMMEWWSEWSLRSCRLLELWNGEMVKLVELSNGLIVEWWNGRVVESSNL